MQQMEDQYPTDVECGQKELQREIYLELNAYSCYTRIQLPVTIVSTSWGMSA
jgi:hypothetical protein